MAVSFTYGTSHAGKTATLIKEADKHEKPIIMTAAQMDTVISRNGESRDAWYAASDGTWLDVLLELKAKVILIDEAQLMTVEMAEELIYLSRALEFDLHLYSVLKRPSGVLYSTSKRILELSDTNTHLTVKCFESGCEAVATHDHLGDLKFAYSSEADSTAYCYKHWKEARDV